jgi:hypothetical protein
MNLLSRSFLTVIAVIVAAGLLTAAKPSPKSILPVVIQPDKDAYYGTDHIQVSLVNRAKKAIWIAPFLTIARGRGDGTYEPVYKLRVVEQCAPKPPAKSKCVKLKAGQKITLAPWDWNTGGYDQCPPRRPGHRAFKGVHRLIATTCADKKRQDYAPRIKFVTWE